MDRAILHIRPENFLISTERLHNPSLRGKAVVILDESTGKVLSCSEECGDFGVHPAMEQGLARRMAPHAIVIPGDPERYRRQAVRFTRMLADAVPVLEKTADDRYFADISSVGTYDECRKWTGQFRQRLMRESGMPISTGLSPAKFVSSMAAAHAGPEMEKYVFPGSEKQFLAPFSIDELPFPHQGMRQVLKKRGILLIGQLAAMSPGTVQRLLGKKGIRPWQDANGICHQALVPYTDPDAVSSEVVFSRDCRSSLRLLSILNSMADKLCHSLRKTGRAAGLVTVKLGYPDLTTSVRNSPVPPLAIGKKLSSKAQDLFHALYDRSRGVRMIGLRFSDLEQRSGQMQLFTGRSPASIAVRSESLTTLSVQ